MYEFNVLLNGGSERQNGRKPKQQRMKKNMRESNPQIIHRNIID